MDHRADDSSVRIGKRHLLRHAVATIAYRGLRRLAGSPVRGENYFTADIVHGRVGREQSAPRREFD